MNIKSLHGQNKDALAKIQKGNWRYDVVEAGFKCNMTDISASLGLVEIERYDSDTLKVRQNIFKIYSELFSKYNWAQIPVFNNSEKISCFHLYALRIKGITESQRDQIIQEIYEQDVSVNVHFIPIPMLSFYKNMGYDIKNYPIAFDNYSREISLPVYYDLTEDLVKTVAEVVIKSVEKIIN